MNDLRLYRQWYNNSYLLALDKLLALGKISESTYKRLNRPVEKYEFDYK